MKYLLKAILISLVICTGSSYSQLDEQWQSIYNGPGDGSDVPTNIAVDGSGNVYTAGYSKGINTGNGDIALVKYNSSGVEQWVARYNGLDSNTDAPSAIILNGGSIYVTGHSAGDPILLRYDQNGNLLSSISLAGYGNIRSLTEDSQGNVIACGSHLDSIVLFKFSLSGNILWHKNYLHPGTGSSMPLKVLTGSNGVIYVCGRVYTATSSADAILTKFDNNGNMIWSKTYNSVFNLFDTYQDLVILNDGSICVAGNLADTANFGRGIVARYSAQGNLMWISINQPYSTNKIACDELGGIYVSASIYISPSERGPGIIKYHKNGTILWHRYHYPVDYSEYPFELKIRNCFNIYISYLAVKQGGFPSYSGISKFNSNGSNRWNFKKYTIVQDTSLGTGWHVMTFGNYRTLYTATTGWSNPRKNDFHTAEYLESYHSVSGMVTYKDNNQPVEGGFVKALYYDEATSSIVTVDSAEIQINGSYTLTKMPEDSLDLMFYQNDDFQQFVPTYYVSTIDWQEATKIYAAQNLTDINCQVYRITGAMNPYNIGGLTLQNPSQGTIYNLDNVIVYAKVGSEFKNYGVSNSGGQYTVTKLAPGGYTLIAHRMGFSPVTLEAKIFNSSLSGVNVIFENPIGIDPPSVNIPSRFSLSQNYPNPFNPVTIIKFDIPKEGFVKLAVYDILGRETAVLINREMKAGSYSADWNASGFPSGIYFYRLESADYKETKKMILIK